MNVTVIITASYIPSHPRIDLIQETIESLRYTSCTSETPIILAHDYNNHPRYKQYMENLQEYIKDKPNIKSVMRTTRGCLVGNVRHALSFVNTEFILLLQHDLPFLRQLPDLSKVMEDMKVNPSLKHVRFNRLVNTYNMYDKHWLFGKQVSSTNFTYTRTPGWSDNNHLALTSYYTDLIMKECTDGGFMEGQLYRKIKDEASHELYGPYLFGGLDEAPYTGHSDGRHTILNKQVILFSNQSPTNPYTPIVEGLHDEFHFTWINPSSFNKDLFLKTLQMSDICIVNLFYYINICQIVPSEYHSKIVFVCTEPGQVHMYGSDSVMDGFTCSAISEELQSLVTKYTVKTIVPITPFHDLSAWRSLFQTVLDKHYRIRIYTKGVFDPYTIDHVNHFEQIKRSYPRSNLVVGILEGPNYDTRVKMVESCKYVDEICHRAPSGSTDSFLKKYNIDFFTDDGVSFTNIKKTSPIHNQLTFVTLLLDLNRSDRTFEDHYIKGLIRLLSLPHPLVVYADPMYHEIIVQKRSELSDYKVDVRPISLSMLEAMPTFDKIQTLIQTDEWKMQAAWMKSSVISSKYYIPLTLIKLDLLMTIAKENPFDSSRFYWIDSGVTNSYNITDSISSFQFTKMPSSKFLLTSFPYNTNTEIHGYNIHTMTKLIGKKSTYVCRATLFGGSFAAILPFYEKFQEVLDVSLKQNAIGAEESLFTIVELLYPSLVHRHAMPSGDIKNYLYTLRQLSIVS